MQVPILTIAEREAHTTMIEIGKIQTLVIDHVSKIGPYLAEPGDPGKTILLPGKEMPKNARAGDELEAFVYRDSSDRPIATLRRPKILLGEMKPLKVGSITKVGAFMDWGLEKDLLLPYHEQTAKVQIGREYLVFLYLDKSRRLCATMKVYNELKSESPYKEGDWVDGYVYQINPELGAFVAVNYQYHGLIPKKELGDDIHCGNLVHARVSEIRKRDGKLTLSPNKKGYKEIPSDAKIILRRLEKEGGFLPFNDKTPPAVIMREFGISKAAFKRAVGHLLKIRRITLTREGMQQVKKGH